jgi:LysM repeat protein
MKQIRIILLSISGVGVMMVMFWLVVIMLNQEQGQTEIALTPQPTETAGIEIPPNTPLPSLTPTQTLLPPPTLEPPTVVPQPTEIVRRTATFSVPFSGIVPPLHGLETPTPTNHVACEPRKDWTLIYEVTHDDALVKIADAYQTSVEALVNGNCLDDADVIYIGQRLRVPGGGHPVTPQFVCQEWQVLTPMDYAVPVDVNGQLTFNWRGSNGTRNLIRVYDGNGSVFWERTIDLRQNETITLSSEGFVAGAYSWQIFPLDLYFQQIPCGESPRWHFSVEGTAIPVITAP